MKILAADDERIALKNIVGVLEEVLPEAEILAFRSGEALLESEAVPEAVIAFLDVEMRGISGVETAEELKKRNPTINIIFTTGFSQYTGNAMALHASGYIMKPITVDKVKAELQELRFPLESKAEKSTEDAPAEEKKTKLRVQTFGDFEVFEGDKPLRFRYNKTKEMLAYLIDRRGALCSIEQILSMLWEDDDDYMSHVSYFKNMRRDLQTEFERIGIPDALAKKKGMLGIVPSYFDCDYFDWMAGKPHALDSYFGEYMSQYSWSEGTHGLLEEARLSQKYKPTFF